MEKYVTEKVEGIKCLIEDTGELKDVKITKKVSYDEFLLIFLSSMPEMMKLHGSQLKILIACWKYSSFNPIGSNDGNIIHNNINFKNVIRKEGLDLTNAAIDVYISQLSKLGFLIKRCKGEYMLNPKYFFKGRHTDATKLSLTIETDKQKEK